MSDKVRHNTVITAISKIRDRVKAADACLIVIYGRELGKKFNLSIPELVIGRSSKADIQIDQDAVSRNHCKIINSGDKVVIRDLGSTNGTYVNDELIEESELKDGNLIKIGRVIFKYLSGDNIEAGYHEEIYRLTTMDGLTQIFNRRYLMESLDRELGRAQRYHRDLALIMFDIDKFKDINDTFGHLAGDYVLKKLAEAIKGRIRREDIFGRYGGEEFVIVLPETSLSHARQFSEKIRALIERTKFNFEGDSIKVTISVGVTAIKATSTDPDTFLQEADELMLQAKRQGRNCIVG